jgi:hypothetical protein
LKKYALNYHENAFFIVGIVKKRIFRVGSNWIRNCLLVKEDPDPDPDPKLGGKWDPNPDPKKIVSASGPQHWLEGKVLCETYCSALALPIINMG